jgi:co-chaperonin GroES (HSP10)
VKIDPTTVRPRDGWCLLRREPRREQLDWGLYLPVETVAEKLGQGVARVVRVGNGKLNVALGLALGDRVILRDYLRVLVPVPGTEGDPEPYFLVNSEDIVAVVAADLDVHVFSSKKED